MRTVTHLQIGEDSAEILRAVAAGETIQVTNNGKVVAIISPPRDETVLERLIAAGEARPASKPMSTLPAPKHRSRLSTKEIINDIRGDR